MMTNLHRLKQQRKRTARDYRCKFAIIAWNRQIFRFSGMDIGRHRDHFSRERGKGIVIKRYQLFRYFSKNKIYIKKITFTSIEQM